jgi:hypothetical protein
MIVLLSPNMKKTSLVVMMVGLALMLVVACKKGPLPECTQAYKCCQALNGTSDASCAPLLQSPKETCTLSLGSFKTAIKKAKPESASQCD